MSNPTKFDHPTPSGRIAHDEYGRATWEWRTASGDFKSDIDTGTVRALQEAAQIGLGEAAAVASGHSLGSYNPYSSADTPVAPRTPRRTLDDMRRLSEEIKRARQLKKA